MQKLDVPKLAERFTPEVLVALRPESGMVRQYIGITGDPNVEFEMQVGFPVAVGTAVPAGFESAEHPAFRAYGLVFSGPLEHLSKAYAMAYEWLFQDGKFPSGTLREHVLYWEGAESPNNVVVIQIGLVGP